MNFTLKVGASFNHGRLDTFKDLIKPKTKLRSFIYLNMTLKKIKNITYTLFSCLDANLHFNMNHLQFKKKKKVYRIDTQKVDN